MRSTLLLTPVLLALSTSATLTITRTVERVVQTTWATSTPATSSIATWEAPEPSVYATSYSNGTGVATGVYPSGSATGTVPVIAATGAASRFGVDVIGFAAVAGMVGMVAF